MDYDKDLARIVLQEERLQFDRFDPATAWALGTALKAEADRRGAAVAIDISTHSHQLFHYATAGATPDNAEWVRRKRNVTLRFFRSSYAIGLALKRDGTTLEAKYGLGADFMAHGGSFPIRIAGSGSIGAVTVSGLPQREDHNMVVAVLAEMLGQAREDLALP